MPQESRVSYWHLVLSSLMQAGTERWYNDGSDGTEIYGAYVRENMMMLIINKDHVTILFYLTLDLNRKALPKHKSHITN